jgi:hypothetical protein
MEAIEFKLSANQYSIDLQVLTLLRGVKSDLHFLFERT